MEKKPPKNPLKKMKEAEESSVEDIVEEIDPRDGLLLALYKVLELESKLYILEERIMKLEERKENVDDR